MCEVKTIWFTRIPTCKSGGRGGASGAALHHGGEGLCLPFWKVEGGLSGGAHVGLGFYRKRQVTAKGVRCCSISTWFVQRPKNGVWKRSLLGVEEQEGVGQELHWGSELQRQRNLSNT